MPRPRPRQGQEQQPQGPLPPAWAVDRGFIGVHPHGPCMRVIHAPDGGITLERDTLSDNGVRVEGCRELATLPFRPENKESAIEKLNQVYALLVSLKDDIDFVEFKRITQEAYNAGWCSEGARLWHK